MTTFPFSDIVFSTAHKAKGLEFDTVRVTDDFLPGADLGIPLRESQIHYTFIPSFFNFLPSNCQHCCLLETPIWRTHSSTSRNTQVNQMTQRISSYFHLLNFASWSAWFFVLCTCRWPSRGRKELNLCGCYSGQEVSSAQQDYTGYTRQQKGKRYTLGIQWANSQWGSESGIIKIESNPTPSCKRSLFSSNVICRSDYYLRNLS